MNLKAGPKRNKPYKIWDSTKYIIRRGDTFMDQTVFEFTAWLDTQTGNTLHITKEERAIGKHEVSDLDQVHIQLHKVAVKHIERTDTDHYLADQEIILHGQGKIQSDKGDMELPQGVYEIPLYGKVSARKAQDGFQVETERAFYSIQVH
jgi:hypothetical protein